MEQKYTPAQLADLERVAAALAAIPAEKRQVAVREAIAYIRGYASGVQGAADSIHPAV